MGNQSPEQQRHRAGTIRLSVVVPVYNEEACIEQMLSRLTAVLAKLDADSHIVFVNDGSSDGTLELLRQYSSERADVSFITFSRNFGHQFALAAGIDHADGDAVVSLDGDLQHPPEMIPTLLEHWRNGKDVVYTVRRSNEGHHIKEVFSRTFYWLMRKLTGVDVPTGGADFRLIDRRVADALRQCREKHVFVRGLVPWLGFSREGVPYDAEARYGGESKYVTRRMVAFALDGIFSFSIVPLRIISLIGVITICVGFLYGVYSVMMRLLTEDTVSGWASLVIVVLVFSGTQLLSLGILSEYVGRMYEEVKKRPRYIVADRSADLKDLSAGTDF